MKPPAIHGRRSLPLRLAAAALSLCAAPDAAWPAPSADFERSPLAREIDDKLRAMAATTSADGAIRVSGASLDVLDRMEILRFVADVRARLERLADTKFQGRHYGIAIHVADAEEDRPAAISRQLVPPAAGEPDATAHPTIRIAVTHLAKLDPRELTLSICDAMLRMKVVEAAAGATTLQPPPRWFADGLGHYLEAARRQDDAEDVLGLWQQAGLQPLGRLAASHSPYASADRRVAAQLAAYWLDFPDRGPRLDRLCRALASGEAWSSALFAETSSGIADLVEADKDFDRWLLSRRDSVLTPGVTRREFAVRAWRGLLLFPGEDAVPAEIPAGTPPALLLEHLGKPWVRDCARAKALRLMALAAGRGPEFREAAVAWSSFFEGVARGESRAKLEAALPSAEALMPASAAATPP